ncbi:MAG: SLC13 family permease [Planctomycetes bacterium]|nr:SLC13 family permease [Planctomycetota bacterium]
MTVEIGVLLTLVAGMVYLFLTEKLPVDLTAFLGLVVLLAGRYVTPQEAFAGFSSPAVITMLSVFIIGAALQHTGIADAVGRWIHALVGEREVGLIVLIMLAAGALSAFMNNVAAAAVLLPAVASISRRTGIAPAQLFIPLAFAAILGGTTTLVGTPTNILAAEVLTAAGRPSLTLFDFTPIGLALLAAGILFMITLGRRLLPVRAQHMASGRAASLPDVYRLDESMISVRVPAGSALAGLTLRQADLGSVLGIHVLSILRPGEERVSPGPEDVIRSGDRLCVQGRFADLEKRLRVQGIELEKAGAFDFRHAAGQLDGAVLRIRPGSPLLGQTVREHRFRERFGTVVAALWRAGQPLHDTGTHRRPLEAGDELLVLGGGAEVRALAERSDLELLAAGAEALARLEANLFVVRVPAQSPLAGTTVAGSRFGEIAGLTVVGVLRHGVTHLSVSPDEPIEGGDRLLVTGEPARVAALLKAGQVRIEGKAEAPRLESERLRVVEAVVAPRATVVGTTIAELSFRERYGLRVLAIWSGDAPIRSGLAHKRLDTGDALLLQGPPERIRLLVADPDFVVLSPVEPAPRRTGRAPLALAALLLMIGLVVSGTFPIQVAAFIGATIAIAGGALTMPEAYRAVEWRAIFLVAAILPLGTAMQATGAAALLASGVVHVAGALGPHAILAMLVVLSSTLSQGLGGAPTVVLLAPVVLGTADALRLSPHPLMMGVGLAASCVFMTPFSQQANLLVMGAGGYRSLDFVKVGTPLTLLLFVLLTVLVPLFLPF